MEADTANSAISTNIMCRRITGYRIQQSPRDERGDDQAEHIHEGLKRRGDADLIVWNAIGQ